MRVLLIETQVTGHHGAYLNGLCKVFGEEDEYQIVLPERMTNFELLKTKAIYIPWMNKGKRQYFQWLGKIIRYTKQYRPDLIHFVYGDDLYRYFGIGLEMLNKIAPVIVTFHQIRRSRLRDFSLRQISAKSQSIIVHTKQLFGQLKEMGIKNIYHIEYPKFNNHERLNKENALRKLEIENTEGKVLLALGGTREDKGLDILLEALQGVKEPFHLIIAGKEEKFSSVFIEERARNYYSRVTCFLEFLSDDKLETCLNAADIIVLPYRRSFDGASGPMGEGVWLRKEIIGPQHGSLGKTIEENHLGYTFKTEDSLSLGKVIAEALIKDWKPDEIYEAYRKELDPNRFVEDYRRVYNH